VSILDRLLGWLDWPIHALLWASLIAGFVMMMHVTADVTGRTVFNHPLHGTTEIVSAYYMVAVAYLPWAFVARNNNHIVAEMFTRIGSARFSAWLEVAVKLATLAYTAVFTWQTGVRAIHQTRAGEVWQAAGDFIAVWPTRWMLPVAAGLMTLYLILRVTSDVARLVRR
jgi:TRAP-type C4-dicarboxylate transport system permease small subunit